MLIPGALILTNISPAPIGGKGELLSRRPPGEGGMRMRGLGPAGSGGGKKGGAQPRNKGAEAARASSQLQGEAI